MVVSIIIKSILYVCTQSNWFLLPAAAVTVLRRKVVIWGCHNDLSSLANMRFVVSRWKTFRCYQFSVRHQQHYGRHDENSCMVFFLGRQDYDILVTIVAHLYNHKRKIHKLNPHLRKIFTPKGYAITNQSKTNTYHYKTNVEIRRKARWQ